LTYIETEKQETLALYREVATLLDTFGRRKRKRVEEQES